MDTSDPEISFDGEGWCNHCRNFDNVVRRDWFPNENGRVRLERLVVRIRDEGRGKEYDSIIGLSGGVDSSYLAYQVKLLGLRPLGVHVDGGWDSELAIRNIERIVKKLGFDLYTHVVDWEEMQDLQRAFFLSGVANLDVPQDHAFFAALYRFAVQNGIRYVLSGSNYATEAILPHSWGYIAMDRRHLVAIHRVYGRRPLRSFPTVRFSEYYIYYPYIRGMVVVRPLNCMLYDREEAIKLLEMKLDWKSYGAKHCESRFTKFFQRHYLPTKFGYDKRRAHFSSMIVTGLISREESLKEMEVPLYDPVELCEDIRFVLKKLELTEQEYGAVMSGPNRSHRDYESNEELFAAKERIAGILRKLRRSRA